MTTRPFGEGVNEFGTTLLKPMKSDDGRGKKLSKVASIINGAAPQKVSRKGL